MDYSFEQFVDFGAWKRLVTLIYDNYSPDDLIGRVETPKETPK